MTLLVRNSNGTAAATRAARMRSSRPTPVPDRRKGPEHSAPAPPSVPALGPERLQLATIRDHFGIVPGKSLFF